MAATQRGKKSTRNSTPKKGRKPATAPDWKPVFLKELARTGNVSAAAHKAKIDRSMAYEFRSLAQGGAPAPEAVTFARAWDVALEVAIDALELEARRRAAEGVLEPVGWYQGVAGGKVRRYSDTLLIVLLKAHRPEKYRENIHQEHTGKDGGPIEIGNLTDDERAARVTALLERARARRVEPAAPDAGSGSTTP